MLVIKDLNSIAISTDINIIFDIGNRQCIKTVGGLGLSKESSISHCGHLVCRIVLALSVRQKTLTGDYLVLWGV